MGTVASIAAIRLQDAGEDRVFHAADKDDSKQPGQNRCVVVHVPRDVSQCIDVLFICDEWGSSKGGLSTFNREFAVNLAKASTGKIKIHCYVCSSSEEDRQDASKQGVNLITARRLPGSADLMEGLKMPPSDLPYPHVVVGHGRKFGSAAHIISDRAKCWWVQFVHVFCEDLGKHKQESGATSDAIEESEEKSEREIELCEAADLVVAVGSLLQRKYSKLLPDIRVEVITPGMFEKFVIQRPVKFLPAEEFRVFMFGRGSFEDFELKGYDIIAKALASLGRKYELTFVGSPHGEQKKLQKWFLDETKIAKNQLNIRGYCDYEKMKKMLRQADVIVMPSRTEGFGLVALEAISAGVPVLVSSECGIAKALKDVKGGKSVVVNSDKPEEWARRIHDLSELKAEERNARAIYLREQYGKIYNWQKECERFKEMIHELVQRQRKAVPLNLSLTDQDGGMTVKVEAVISLHGNEAQMNNNTVPLTDQKRNSAPPTTSKTRFKKTNKVGVLATDSDKSTDSQTSTEYRQEDSATDQDGNTVSPSRGAKRKTGELSMDSDESTASQTSSECTEEDSATGVLKHYMSNSAVEVQMHPTRVGWGFTDSDESTASQTSTANTEQVSATGSDFVDKDKNEWNSLHSAAEDGDVTKIESLLSRGISVNSRDDQGATPLMKAALNDKLQAVEYLLTKGANPPLENNNGWNLLHCASGGGNPVIIELMLSHVPSIDSINNEGVTALMIAAANGKLQAVEYLLKKGANPSLESNNGGNLLHWAPLGGNIAVIEKILSYGVDIKSRAKDGLTPLMIAQEEDQYGNVTTVKVEPVVSAEEEVAQTNRERNPLTDRNPVSSTPSTADRGAKQNKERDPLTADPGGNTVSSTPSTDRGTNQNKDKDPLTAHDGSKVSPSLTVTGVKQNNEQESSTEPDRSSKTKQTERNKEGSPTTDQAPPISLDNKGARSNKGQVLPTDSNKNTSSQTSSKCTETNSNKEGASATGSDFVDKDKDEWNSLHDAAKDGDITKIESLLSRGFSIDSRAALGSTPLMVAAGHDKLQAVEYLLTKGANPSLEDNDGWNLLHRASQGGNPVIIELMLSHVPSIDSINNEGHTALMTAAARGKLQAVEYLLAKGANPSLEDNNGWNLLHRASEGGNPAIIELMLSHVPSIDSINNKGVTALMVAAFNGKLQAVEYLLKKGANPSLEDNNGWNLLHSASQGGNPVIIELMLSHVPSIDSITNKGSTALMVAAGHGKLQAVEYLLAKGANPSLEDNDG
ncbi:hypothetical protein ACROYT_G030022 [Oculina patagonica]